MWGRRSQSWFGAFALNVRSTRSGAGRASWSRVLRSFLRRQAPSSFEAFIRRATRFRPTQMSSVASIACTRGAPYVPRDASWIA